VHSNTLSLICCGPKKKCCSSKKHAGWHRCILFLSVLFDLTWKFTANFMPFQRSDRYRTQKVVMVLVRSIESWDQLVQRQGCSTNQDVRYKSERTLYKFKFASQRSVGPSFPPLGDTTNTCSTRCSSSCDLLTQDHSPTHKPHTEIVFNRPTVDLDSTFLWVIRQHTLSHFPTSWEGRTRQITILYNKKE